MKKTIYSVITVFTIILLLFTLEIRLLAVTEQDKEDLQDKINNATQQLDDIAGNKNEAQSELEELTVKVSDAQNELASIKSELEAINEAITVKEEEIRKQEEEIKEKDELLKQRMVAMYESGDTSFLDVLFNSESILDFFSNYSLVQQIVESDTELIEKLEQEKVDLEKNKNELEEQKAEVENLKKEQEIKNAELEQLQKSKQEELENLSAEEQAVQAEIDSYNEAMAKVNAALEEAARKAAEEMEKNEQNNGTNGLNFDGSFIWPCNNKYVTSRMKWRWGRWHKGIDIGASYENVYASASGYAYNEYDANGYGVYVMVFHGDGYVTLYGHLSESHVSNGQYVSQGEVIATSGNSGASQGAHLHFEIRKATSFSDFFGNNWLDPLDYLPGGYTILD